MGKVWCLIASLFVGAPAWALCTSDEPQACIGPGGCPGTRECPGICQCDVSEPCTTACGRSSWLDEAGECMAVDESCNNCDDDGDGVVDDGVSCVAKTPFTPKCGSYTGIQVALGSNRLADDPNTPKGIGTRYANNLAYTARLYTNPLIEGLVLEFSTLKINAFDTLKVIDPSGVTSDLGKFVHFEPRAEVPVTLAGLGQSSGLAFTFDTGPSITDDGWILDKVDVTCGAAASTTIPFLTEDDADTYGLLTACDDVVFFRIPVGAEPLSVWIDGVDGPLNADLYARYDAVPEHGVADFSSAGTTSDEWIDIDQPLAGHTLFIAVHSAHGTGSFNIRMARVKPTMRWADSLPPGRPLNVGTGFTATAGELDQIEDMLLGAQRFMVGMTEGKVQLRQIDLYNRSGTFNEECDCGVQGCDVCVFNNSGRAQNVFGYIRLFKEEWELPSSAHRFSEGSKTLGHELGHLLLGLGDEYRDHGIAAETTCVHADLRCSSSAMAHQQVTGNLCTDLDHGGDTSPIGHVCGNCPFMWYGNATESGQSCTDEMCNACLMDGGSAWSGITAAGFVYSMPIRTPNDITYENFALPFTVVRR